MTIDESLEVISERMIGGVMLHSQLFNYFKFLGLKGYAECQKYHYYDESKHYIELCDYSITHCNKLLPDKPIENVSITPADWYMFTRFDVDANIRKTSVKTGIEKWVQWERDTKRILEQHYQNLINLNEVTTAREVDKIIKHVGDELSHAETKMLFLKAIDYDIMEIMSEQNEIYKQFKKKVKEIEL